MIDDKQKTPQWDHMKQKDATEQQIVASRMQRNQQKKNNPEAKEEQREKSRIWVQIRLFPIWLRIILVIAILGIAAVLGAMVGYGYIGDGQPSDVLNKDTWTHIIDIISGKES
ncbi:DNA-directed RNA polymerase subunit beta [Sporosarcina oncorhynchi]|uniref:DNA-directed RNA polymerase subunit beta n=1 Tax=Sporosarcina oncorhynchi TaxID=3056444 RepID=A0ABZ0L908_9BACL|nr:DNA-directed RNA polymerase subunit beta [Sporosarcina sp. T2O-4]WOV88016.1 DNA-directed RNA polymerase subunit beta [Sporosarcina sp. T2O-4]